MDSRRAKNTDFTERQTNPCHKHMQNCKTRCLLQINLPHAKVILHSQDTLVYVAQRVNDSLSAPPDCCHYRVRSPMVRSLRVQVGFRKPDT